MFKKKNSEPIDWVIYEFDKRISDYQCAKLSLVESVGNVLMKKDAVEVYPDGPDKNRAKQDLEISQRKLIGNIGSVDARRQEMFEFYQNHCEKLTNYKHPRNYADSHTIIEIACKNYCR